MILKCFKLTVGVYDFKVDLPLIVEQSYRNGNASISATVPSQWSVSIRHNQPHQHRRSSVGDEESYRNRFKQKTAQRS